MRSFQETSAPVTTGPSSRPDEQIPVAAGSAATAQPVRRHLHLKSPSNFSSNYPTTQTATLLPKRSRSVSVQRQIATDPLHQVTPLLIWGGRSYRMTSQTGKEHVFTRMSIFLCAFCTLIIPLDPRWIRPLPPKTANIQSFQ